MRKERKETWEYKGWYIYWSLRGGSVSDGTSGNEIEERWGSVRGNGDQSGVSRAGLHHQGRFKNSIEGIGSMDIARGIM